MSLIISSGQASFNPLEAYAGMIQLSDLIRNILICVPKTNESLKGLEQHEDWVISDRVFILGWTNPLNLIRNLNAGDGNAS